MKDLNGYCESCEIHSKWSRIKNVWHLRHSLVLSLSSWLIYSLWEKIQNAFNKLIKKLSYSLDEWNKRRRPGIPSTLNFISRKATKGSSPSYKPFPNAETNRLHVMINLFIKKKENWIHNFFMYIIEKSASRSKSDNFCLQDTCGWV